MKDQTGNRRRSAGNALAVTVFFIVFLIVFITATVVTYLLPKAYVSAGRIRLDLEPSVQTASTNTSPATIDPYLLQTEMEVIRSEVILGKVVETLDLSGEWGKKYAHGSRLHSSESLELLRARLEVRPVRNTSLLEIRVFSDNPVETARIASAVIDSYARYEAIRARGIRVEVLDAPRPPVEPVHPNVPVNLVLGAVVGIVLGLACAAFARFISTVSFR